MNDFCMDRCCILLATKYFEEKYYTECDFCVVQVLFIYLFFSFNMLPIYVVC